MLPLYFLLQILVLVCGWPMLLFLRLRRPDKFRWLRRRLSVDAVLAVVARRKNRSLTWLDTFKMGSCRAQWPDNQPRIWLHALSVGEVSSALPLARAIRECFPKAFFVVTVATETGEKFARQALVDTADLILPAPIDWLPSVRRFLRHLRPDLYIQVETDFWPGLLFSLRQKNIPALLVNGRISAASFSRYRCLRHLFLPMFSCFSILAMQTAGDRDKMLALGIIAARLPVLANLKYAADKPAISGQAVAAWLPPGRRLWVCGSTHPGEEEIIFAAYCQVRARFPDLFLLLAPRRPQRGDALRALAAGHGLTARLRSRLDAENGEPADLLLLDTIGELAACYFLADVAFIGGSLVAEGGHNPLEAAWAGKAMLFGPHMEDFSEIATDLVAAGAAHVVSDANDLATALTAILADPARAEKMGAASLTLVQAKRRGVLDSHLAVITSLLAATPNDKMQYESGTADR